MSTGLLQINNPESRTDVEKRNEDLPGLNTVVEQLNHKPHFSSGELYTVKAEIERVQTLVNKMIVYPRNTNSASQSVFRTRHNNSPNARSGLGFSTSKGEFREYYLGFSTETLHGPPDIRQLALLANIATRLGDTETLRLALERIQLEYNQLELSTPLVVTEELFDMLAVVIDNQKKPDSEPPSTIRTSAERLLRDMISRQKMQFNEPPESIWPLIASLEGTDLQFELVETLYKIVTSIKQPNGSLVNRHKNPRNPVGYDENSYLYGDNTFLEKPKEYPPPGQSSFRNLPGVRGKLIPFDNSSKSLPELIVDLHEKLSISQNQ